MAFGFMGSKGLKVAYSTTRSSNLPLNRYESVFHARQSGADYLMFIDDDMTFEHDDIYKLWLNKLDIVSGIAVGKKWPHRPGTSMYNPVTDKFDITPAIPPQGLIDVDAVGTGFMMIKMSVFNRVPAPWFSIAPHRLFEDYKKLFESARLSLGRLVDGDDGKDVAARLAEVVNSLVPPEKDRRGVGGEDYYFCTRAREVGFKVKVDCGVRVGHIGNYPFTIEDHHMAVAVEKAEEDARNRASGTPTSADAEKAVA